MLDQQQGPLFLVAFLRNIKGYLASGSQIELMYVTSNFVLQFF